VTTKYFKAIYGVTTGTAITLDAASGNITATNANVTNQLISTVATGTAPLAVSSTTRVANLNVAYANVSDLSAITTQTSGNAYLSFANAITGNATTTGNSAFVANTSNGALYATTFIGNGSQLTGITASFPIANGTSNINAPASGGNVNISVGGTANVLVVSSTTVTAPIFAATTNGSGTNFKVGDDAWIGDINTADTISIQGQQNAANAYIVFGNNDSTAKFGRAGSGPLSYTGAMAVSANITSPQLISNIATGTAPLVVTSTTQVANLNVATAGLATYATTANAVAGANVSGTVANATYAVSAGSAGSATSATNAAALLTTLTSTGTVYLPFISATANGNYPLLSNATFSANLANGAITATRFVGALTGAASSLANALTIGSGLGGTSFNGSSAVTITNTGVTSIVAGTNISVSGATGAVTVNVSGTVANATYATSAGSVTNTLTIGSGLGGTSYNGSSAVTITNAGVTSIVAGTNISISGATGAVTVNVSGTVANATYAVSAGSAGSATTAGSTTTVTSGGSVTTSTITTGSSATAGTLTGNWTLGSGSKLQATYADLAEYYAGSEQIEPGTVVEFGGDNEVQICNSPMSTLVAGIVTTNPAYIMNAGIDCEYPIAIALQGRIPAKVIGPVKRGDMMVSTNNGHAMACSSPVMGSVLGKALTNFDGETGIIEIMVGRT